jgi:coenzyme PQQ precursor peptide PqqA
MARAAGVARQNVKQQRRKPMEWTTPQFEEISLNCEINSYAKAEL